ncbi:MAG: cytochrome c5 family protein [Proteobacteria bacterium]|nr:cytochrome c5 family protein [Pseudomonadota bacterium]
MNTFSMVIGGLVVVALAIFALARMVGGHTEVPEVYADAQYVASVDARTKPFAREAVAGADNSAMAIQASPQAAAGAALPVPKDGASLYEAVCKNCHGPGLIGAPKFGDHAAWAPRIAKGKATLYEHALKGFNAMPAKGARTDLSDELIKAGVDFMVQKGS